MKKMIITLLALVMFMPTINVKAISDVKINSTTFPDSYFRTQVKEQLDINKDRVLDVSEIRNGTKLDVSDTAVRNVQGIEYLTYLKDLDLSGTRITNLDLKTNRRILYLDVSDTSLYSITNISQLKELKTLKISNRLLYNQNFVNVKADKVVLSNDEIINVPKGGKISLKSINSKWDAINVEGLGEQKKVSEKYLSGFNENEGVASLNYKHKDGTNTVIEFNYNALEISDVKVSHIYESNISQIKLTWSEPYSNMKVYEIYRATSKNGTYKKIKSTSYNSYVDKDVKLGKSYYYRIRGYYYVNQHKVYTQFSAKKGKKLELKDFNYLSVDYYDSEGKYKLSWNKITGCDGYQLYRSDSYSGKYKKAFTVESTDTTYLKVKYTRSPMVYYYKIRAYAEVDGKNIYTPFTTPKKVYNF